MKFFHLSDLHLGMRVSEFSMLDDQRYILSETVRLAAENKPDAVLIAGDVYDKSVPSVEAVQLLDGFLVQLNGLGIAVYLISGNHDSVERVAFAASFLHKSDIHIARGFSGIIRPLAVRDEFGPINIWLLPYLKPSTVRAFFEEREITNCSDAFSVVLETMEIDLAERNILLAHQYVTGAVRSESEESFLGGLENIDADLFDAFDYVALGHIHRPQNIGRETLRYCGTPLKYSLSEVNDVKSVTMVDMGRKGDVRISEIPLQPLRDMRELRGSYMEVSSLKNYKDANTDDYVYVFLTDEEEDPDAVMKLRNIYPGIMRLSYDNKRSRAESVIERAPGPDKKLPLELFGELYELQNGQPMSAAQEEYARRLMTKILDKNV